MVKARIRRPKPADIDELNQFFRTVITDTFHKEGIGELHEDIEKEIEAKNSYLQHDLLSGGNDRFFLIALAEEKIIGTIEYGPASELIDKCTEGALSGLYEVGTVFVHPDYQNSGIANQLLNEMYLTLKNKGVEEFCLDSGYKHSQKIWEKKFEEPDYLFKDYWGDGAHHMIWRVRVNELFSV
ncbi:MULTISPECIES: GNAT family N-acetyltransferase [unclassified Cytobacillus]|uniref:GNAT family N-acetyltransferase n=1 Tax=unclassified Cytobacillus TaxID=2675268 RepID=UPI001358E5A9|nr:GNAT family N-acetyltransferase [Cytobacillus sp. AMY 15.2]KAF0821044.1 Acetyltransferase, GNAT family [Bacillus sp. ZZV12-4809]MCM3090998.1 GNAT family N-acetyltransferase [Cytobacillus sp. AMY 15.2]